METLDDDLAKSAEELIRDMRQLIGGSATNPAFNTLSAMQALHKFACVLVVVSREADRQSKRIVALTWALLILTVALLAFTVVMAVRG
jgi:hypothetical protein